DDMSDQCSLTQAGLEEYNIRASSYYDQPAMLFHHQKQSSYAQSEGYHSYVSSSDSSSATPFLDRLRQESEMLSRQSSHHWSQNDLSSVSCASMAPSPTPLLLATIGRDVALTGGSSGSNQQQHNNSSESTSSTETLKWLGSMSDVSEASHATGYSAISESVSSSQLIVHSSRVLTPKRHHSESVLYLHDESQQPQQAQPPLISSAQQHSPSAPKQISPTLSARERTHSPTRLMAQNTALLPNHRHSPSYPPVHATAAMHPYQPHPQYAVRQQPQSLAHKLPAAAPLADALPSSLSASVTDGCNLSTHASAKTSPLVSALKATDDGGSDVAAPPPLPTQNTSMSVTNTQAEVEALTSALASHSPAIAPKPVVISSSATNAIVEVIAIGAGPVGGASLSPGSANSQLNTSTTSLASAVSSASAQPSHSYRSNHRLFAVSTYTEKVHSNTSQFVLHPKPQYSAGLQKPVQQQQQQQQQQPQLLQKQAQQTATSVALATKYLASPTSPPQPSWQSVAELINDFERTKNEPQLQKYTYMDPSKTHRVSNPALKAFQKNAVQSYFERQQQQQQHAKEQGQSQKIYQPLTAHSQHQHQLAHQHQHSPPQQQQQQHSPLLRPHSYQSNMKESDTQHQIMRSSLPNSYGAQHSNLSGSTFQQQKTSAQQLPMRLCAPPPPPPPQKPTSGGQVGSNDEHATLTHAVGASSSYSALPTKPPSPAPPPPPPRSRSLIPHTLLRRSSSASDYAEFRDQYMRATQEKLVAQSVKNISSSEKSSFNDCGMPPPPPPPRAARPTNLLPTRRTSSAAEYAAAMREKALLQQAAALAHQQHHPQQHARPPNYVQQYYNPPLPAAAIEPGWVPERPPKNPSLRVPSPDLPPLPPSADLDTQLADEPLPPPPPELLQQQRQQYQQQQQQQLQQYYDLSASMNASCELVPKAPSPNRRNSFAGSSSRKAYFGRSCSETSPTSASLLAGKLPPPLIPKKPNNIEALHASMRQQQQQQHTQQLAANRLLLNGGVPQPQQHSPTQVPSLTSASNAKLLTNRKRPHHNPALAGFNVPPPILENVQQPQQPSSPAPPQQLTNSSKSPSNTNAPLKSSPPPPPLMPRCMPTQTLVSGGNGISSSSSSIGSNSNKSSVQA
ncbi:PREDICTED: protein Shroom-like, partial [Rhagoletis zephyria]|uniref:protein Shroom-like n=1 Tax=Rhagoletis zephyria TaxID=28612 RepID=UPI0008119E68